MGSIEIFSSAQHLSVTLVAMLILAISAVYSSVNTRLGKTLALLMTGLGFELLSNGIGYYAFNLQLRGDSVSTLVFIELLMLLCAMAFFAFAASQILTNNVPDTPIISIFSVIGLVSIIYFVAISPDGAMVDKMLSIFPIAGLAYVAGSLWSHVKKKQSTGYIMAAATVSMVVLFLGFRLAGIDFLLSQVWYLSALTYIFLAISFIIIKTDCFYKEVLAKDKEIEKSNKRIEGIIKSSPFPIIISRVGDDKILLANTNAVKLFGIHPQELDRYRLRDFFADADNRRHLNERLEQEKEVQDFEILVKTPSGNTPFWLLASVNVIDYNYDVALYSAFQDITSRKNREVLLKNQAVRDPLTSLFNRRYFEEEVSKRISAAKLNEMDFSVLMIDADHFKNVNDTYGHKIGDKVLIELAATCEKALREDDIVARYGGEEFVIFLSKVNAQKAKTVADRLRETIANIVVYSEDNKQIKFTVSIGISSSEVSDSIDTLIKTADEALYKAKNNGRNRCEIFTKEDLENFKLDSKKAEDEEKNLHPVFSKEHAKEVSLLDDINTIDE